MIQPTIERYPIAIDLSDGLTRVALQLATVRGKRFVRATLRKSYEAGRSVPDTETEEVSFIKEVLRNPAFKGKRIALIPPADLILSYPLRVAVAKNETLEEAIAREAGKVLDAPLADMIIDFASVQSDPTGEPGTHRVLLLAIRRDTVERHLDLVKQAGGCLEAIEADTPALVRAHCACASLSDRPVLLCDIGQVHSSIVVATADGIEAHRNVQWGTEGLVHTLVENLELGDQTRDATFLLHEHGLSQMHPYGESGDGMSPEGASGTVSQLLTPLVDTFVHELHNITGYIRSQIPGVAFGGVFLYGEGARVSGLDRYFEDELGIEAKVINPLETFEMLNAAAAPVARDGSLYTLGLGLGLRRLRWL